MKLRVTSVDYAPQDLYAQTPFETVLLREIPGSDRPDYWLAALTKPIRWLHEGVERQVTHLVLAARWVGTRIGRGMRSLPVNIAYVLDDSVLTDSTLDFKKTFYCAIGVADEIDHAA